MCCVWRCDIVPHTAACDMAHKNAACKMVHEMTACDMAHKMAACDMARKMAACDMVLKMAVCDMVLKMAVCDMAQRLTFNRRRSTTAWARVVIYWKTKNIEQYMEHMTLDSTLRGYKIEYLVHLLDTTKFSYSDQCKVLVFNDPEIHEKEHTKFKGGDEEMPNSFIHSK